MEKNYNQIINGIHKTHLECLLELDRICESEKIIYSIAYGTMLGAIRHKGFIPWDDDLDVCMPYEDIMRIDRSLGECFFLQTWKSDSRCPFCFAKIRKNGTRMIEEHLSKLDIHHGIWIDIFPYVDAPNSKFLKKIQFFFVQIHQAMRCRALNKQNGKKSILTVLPDGFVMKIENCLLFLIKFIGKKHSKEYLVMSNDTYENSYIERHFLDRRKRFEFEGYNVWGIEEYDQYLKKYYGEDYMTPMRWTHIKDYSGVEY